MGGGCHGSLKVPAKTFADRSAIRCADKLGGESALAGIVVSGLGFDGRCYVMEDCSGRMSPGEWGARAIRAFDDWFADRIVAEGNVAT
jgi:phage terminase large subunit-like protein